MKQSVAFLKGQGVTDSELFTAFPSLRKTMTFFFLWEVLSSLGAYNSQLVNSIHNLRVRADEIISAKNRLKVRKCSSFIVNA